MSSPDAIVHDWPLEFGYESREITAYDGTVLRLVVGGPATAPPVILLHGAPQHAYCWRKVMPLLTDRFRVIAPDLRGYGSSELARSGRYDVEILTNDLLLTVEAAEAWAEGDAAKDGVRLIAHDWGGPIAWTFAERYPGLVKHLVAVNAPHPAAFVRELSHPRQLFRSWYIIAFQIPGIEAWVERNDAEALVRMIAGSAPKGLYSSEELEIYRANLKRPGRARAVLAYYQQAFGFKQAIGPDGKPAIPGDPPSLKERLQKILRSERIRVPATIVWGDADIAIAPSHPDATRRYVDHLEIRRLVGVSHWVPEERPAEVALSLGAAAQRE